MNTSQGQVALVTEKQLDNGRGTVYSFKLEDGNWFGLGFTKPSFDKGDFIEFAYDQKGQYKNADAKSVVVKDTAPAAPAAQTAAPAAKTNWDEKDKRITMLACRNASIELAKLGIEAGAIKLGAKNKMDNLLNTVEALANDLYYGIYGADFDLKVRDVDRVAAQEEAFDGEE